MHHPEAQDEQPALSYVERHCGVAEAPELEADEESAVVPGHYTEESPHCVFSIAYACLAGVVFLAPGVSALGGVLRVLGVLGALGVLDWAPTRDAPPAARPQISAPSACSAYLACSRSSAAWLPGVWSVARASAQARRLPSRLGREQQLLAVRNRARGEWRTVRGGNGDFNLP
jgi:hypothetical protein